MGAGGESQGGKMAFKKGLLIIRKGHVVDWAITFPTSVAYASLGGIVIFSLEVFCLLFDD